MNEDITKESIGTVTVRDGRNFDTWTVESMTTHGEKTEFTLAKDGEKSVVVPIERHQFGDSLRVIRGILKEALLNELDRRKSDAN